MRAKETKKRKITTVEDTLCEAVREDPMDEEEATANERKWVDLLLLLLRAPGKLP